MADNGVRNGDTIEVHRRIRGGLDIVLSILIGVAVVLGLIALYYILPKIVACLGWFWRNVIAPPLFCLYDYILTPIGHFFRDCIFATKEACCDCYDGCDTCCNPYKRV